MNKKAIFLAIPFICSLQQFSFAQTIKFQYDTKGNQIAAKYTGSNGCIIPPMTPNRVANQLDSTTATPAISASVKEEKVDWFANTAQLNIYPNPSQDGIVNVDFQLSSEGPAEITVISAVGQVLYVQKFDKVQAETVWVSLKDQNTGIYFVKLTSLDGTKSARLILQL